MYRSITTFSLVLLAAFAPASPGAGESADSMTIVIGGGSHAGTYKLPAANIMCMLSNSGSSFSAAYKDMEARKPNMISGAGINVDHVDGSGPKTGEINITFGDPEEKGDFTLEARVPDKGKHGFTYSKSGKAVTVSFDGRTNDGVELHVKAHCDDPMAFRAPFDSRDTGGGATSLRPPIVLHRAAYATSYD